MKRLIPFLMVVVALSIPRATGATLSAFGDIDVFSAFVPPNVMIVLDSSEKMNHHLWDDDFNPKKLYSETWCGDASVNWGAAPMLTGTSCPSLSNPSDECPNNDWVVGDGSNGNTPAPHELGGNGPVQSYTFCGVTRNLYHDSSTSPKTRYSLNYLNWLFGVATTSELTDEPTTTRLQIAKDMISKVIIQINDTDGDGDVDNDDDEMLRIGIASLDGSNNAEGWNLSGPIATGSTQSNLSNIQGISANDDAAPLSEALLDAGIYFAGKNNALGTLATSPFGSPIDLECRKSFAVVISAGEPTEDGQDHRSTEFMATIGNFDSDANECTATAPPANPATCTDDPVTGRDDGLVYLNSGTDWLDDVAAYLYQTDLSPLDGTQNLITYTIGFLTDHPLLRETAQNGDGKYYVSDPNNVDSFADSLTAALLDIIERATAFTAATVPASRTAFGDGFYTAYFIPSNSLPNWEGHLEAYRLDDYGLVLDKNGSSAIDPNTGIFLEPRAPVWDAAETLLDPNFTRSLYTTKNSARLDFTTSNIAATDLQISAAELPSYPMYPDAAHDTADELADRIVEFVHGQDVFDEDTDANTSELRSSVLADIFHSNPIVIGPPRMALIQEEGFGIASPAAPGDTPFYEEFEQRDRLIYAGSNGGMLHAFDAGAFEGDDPNTTETETRHYTHGTGVERFGYIPEFLRTVADPNEGLSQIKHLPLNSPRLYYYMDGSAVVADAHLRDPNDADDITRQPSEWATVLMAGARSGGRGYLALDITDPDDTTSAHSPFPKLLWEFDGDSHSELGETWSEPVITRVKVRGATSTGDHCGDTTDGDGDCREQWVAIFGAGYEQSADPQLSSFEDDPNDSSWSDRGKAIFMVTIDTGEVLAKIAYDPNTTSEMIYSLPSSPAVLDVDFDGLADVVYIGDAGGQMWKWLIHDVGEDSTSDGIIDNWSSEVFFRIDPDSSLNHYRSIFYPPAVTKTKGGTLYLAFGTGERTNLTYAGDSSEDENNRFYVVKDPSWSSLSGSVLTEVNLTDVTSKAEDDDLTDSGYFFVADDAEKFITNHLIFAGQVISTSYVPDLSGTNLCDRSGSSRLYIFDVFGGGGYYADSSTTNTDARRLSIGTGAPNDPRITISRNGDMMYIQTSAGRLVQTPPPPRPGDPVETIYWKQGF